MVVWILFVEFSWPRYGFWDRVLPWPLCTRACMKTCNICFLSVFYNSASVLVITWVGKPSCRACVTLIKRQTTAFMDSWLKLLLQSRLRKEVNHQCSSCYYMRIQFKQLLFLRSRQVCQIKETQRLAAKPFQCFCGWPNPVYFVTFWLPAL